MTIQDPVDRLFEQSRDYARVAQAIRWIAEHRLEQPRLEDVAAALGLSPFHVQRLFRRWAGVSPKKFLGFLTLAHARNLLRESRSVLDVALETGLSGPSRLHDLCVAFDAMTPGEIAAGGAGLTLRAGIAPTPFGPVLVAFTERGLAAFEFLADDQDLQAAIETLRAAWPNARFADGSEEARHLSAQLFAGASGTLPTLVVRGTNFQVKVWEALVRRIPPGAAVSYGDLAKAVGHPGASQAVGQALAANRIGWIIPCHRVLRTTGAFKGYRWGAERRRAMLAWEAAQAAPDPETAS